MCSLMCKSVNREKTKECWNPPSQAEQPMISKGVYEWIESDGVKSKSYTCTMHANQITWHV